MDHEQEKFYEAEEQEARAENQPEDGRVVNDMTYFLELMKHLRTLIDRGSKVPLSSRVIIDAAKCTMILDELDKNLPDAIQYGMQMYSERDRLMETAKDDAVKLITTAEMKVKKALDNARRESEQMVLEAEDEANAILEDARERAAHMISEDEIVRQAREEARIIKNDARVEANETRLKANHDAYRLVSQAEGHLEEMLQEMRRVRSEMNNEAE